MRKLTRGEFLGMGATLAGGLGLARPARVGAQTWSDGMDWRVRGAGPDLVVRNARVYTVDDALPRAEAFAVKFGRFLAVGSNDDVANLVTPGTEVIDAAGMTVVPGFIDCHIHPAGGGVNELVSADLDVRTMDAIKERLRAKAAETPPGEWVLGFKYDDTKVAGRRQITIQDLDEAVPNHPVYVSHRGGHIYWYNTKAFELAGVDASTPDPPGGKIYKENGQLSGKIAENANRLFRHVRPTGSTREQRQAGVTLISEKMTAAGLTTVHEGGGNVDNLVAYQDAYHAGELRFRVHMMVSGQSSDCLEGLYMSGVYSGFGHEWIEIRGAKWLADGSASGRTMAMSTPYVGRPDDYGILTMTQEETDEAVERAHRAGFQIVIHANGDRAIDMVLNAYERAQKGWPRPDPRHRIEHCTLVNPDILKRIKALGVIPEPFSSYVHYHGDKWEEYGEERMQWMFPHKSFLDYGIQPTFGSDYVPGPYEPLMGIQSMVTRKDMEGKVWGENQKVTVSQALRIGTVNGARSSFDEDVKGSITMGKLADFVILAEDPHEIDPDRIKEIQVVRTVVGGRTMHEV